MKKDKVCVPIFFSLYLSLLPIEVYSFEISTSQKIGNKNNNTTLIHGDKNKVNNNFFIKIIIKIENKIITPIVKSQIVENITTSVTDALSDFNWSKYLIPDNNTGLSSNTENILKDNPSSSQTQSKTNTPLVNPSLGNSLLNNPNLWNSDWFKNLENSNSTNDTSLSSNNGTGLLTNIEDRLQKKPSSQTQSKTNTPLVNPSLGSPLLNNSNLWNSDWFKNLENSNSTNDTSLSSDNETLSNN